MSPNDWLRDRPLFGHMIGFTASIILLIIGQFITIKATSQQDNKKTIQNAASKEDLATKFKEAKDYTDEELRKYKEFDEQKDAKSDAILNIILDNQTEMRQDIKKLLSK